MQVLQGGMELLLSSKKFPDAASPEPGELRRGLLALCVLGGMKQSVPSA